MPAQAAGRRQLVQALEPEVVEEIARRAQQFRLAGNIAMPDHAHATALDQGLARLSQNLDCNVIGNSIFINETTHKGKIRF